MPPAGGPKALNLVMLPNLVTIVVKYCRCSMGFLWQKYRAKAFLPLFYSYRYE